MKYIVVNYMIIKIFQSFCQLKAMLHSTKSWDLSHTFFIGQGLNLVSATIPNCPKPNFSFSTKRCGQSYFSQIMFLWIKGDTDKICKVPGTQYLFYTFLCTSIQQDKLTWDTLWQI